MGFPAFVALIKQVDRTVENGFDCCLWPPTPALVFRETVYSPRESYSAAFRPQP